MANSALVEAVARRGWGYEQWSIPPLASPPSQLRNQFSLRAVNYSDTVSLAALGVVDLFIAEMRVRVARKVFTELSDRGREAARDLAGEQTVLGVELARFSHSARRYYGSLGLELLYFLPHRSTSGKVAIDTGISATEANPWSLAIGLRYFMQLPERGDRLFVSLAVHRHYFSTALSSVHLGGVARLSLRRRVEETNRAEHLLFSVAPSFAWQTQSYGVIGAEIPLRLWLDKEPNGAGGFTNPLEISGPDVALSWTVQF